MIWKLKWVTNYMTVGNKIQTSELDKEKCLLGFRPEHKRYKKNVQLIKISIKFLQLIFCFHLSFLL